MTTNLQRAQLVSKLVQLRSIALSRANLESRLDPASPPSTIELSHKHRARFEVREAAVDSIYVYVDFDLSVSEGGLQGPSRGLVDLAATYLVVYELPKQRDALPPDALEHFAALNGTFNAWPYWRELVQSATGRVGLGGITVPVFRPKPVRLEEEPNVKAPGAGRGA